MNEGRNKAQPRSGTSPTTYNATKLENNLLYRLSTGDVIIGDGSYVMTLEKRGYVTAGDWTPEAACEHPEAVQQLASEFARAGADVTQTFTFWCSDDNLPKSCTNTCAEINQAACDIAKKITKEKGTILAGGITQTGSFKMGEMNKELVQSELRKSLEVLIENDVDVIICEYFRNIEEMEWALEICLPYGKPLGATMCIGPNGDASGVPVGECAVRMAKAGADLVGANCLFDPFILLGIIDQMKKALDAFNIKTHLMAQPLGYRTPDGGNYGWVDLPEFPFAVEPRQITRYEAKRWAREAYKLGVRYIGGCCGFEPYHIRAMAEELAQERGKMPESSDKSDHNLKIHAKLEENLERYKNKGSKDYWMKLEPATGRPRSTPFCHHVVKNETHFYQPQAFSKAILL